LLKICPFNQERKVDMFEKKKLWMVLASATLVAACGGGSNGGGGDTGSGGGVGGGGGGDGGGDTGGSTPFEETTLQGYLEMGANQLIMDQLLSISDYQGSGIFGQAQGSDDNGAPFQTFGLRLNNTVLGEAGAEGATGRLAINLEEQAGTVGEGEQAEVVEIMMTGVTLEADDAGTLSASVAEDATMYVYGRTATGEIIDNIAVDVPTNAIRVVPITEAPGGAEQTGDDVGLLFDLDAAFAAAEGDNATALSQLSTLSGRFDMNFALSAADIHLTGSDEALADQTIGVTNNDLEPVVGSGAPGNIWIGMDPAAE
jgi:hypothetical protein